MTLLEPRSARWAGWAAARQVVVCESSAGDDDRSGRAIRAFNDHAAADSRVELTILSIGDGLTFAVKR